MKASGLQSSCQGMDPRTEMKDMGKNIVICFDGTSNEFGPSVTNVVRLVQLLRHESEQVVHYAPGIGTMPGPGFVTYLGQKFSLLSGLAFGTGLTGIVCEAYEYLMNAWEPGDRVFLFGFSRGAYTARVLAAMLHAMGLLPRGNGNMVPYAMRLFQSVRGRTGDGGGDERTRFNYWKLLNQFRFTFARTGANIGDRRGFPIHFVGVWDTVSSVGWIWEPGSFPYTRTNPSIDTVRHALAIDERRWFFRQNEFSPADGQDCVQRWFAGSHGDVGGGYTDKQAWRCSFDWIVAEAVARGLLIDPLACEKLKNSAPTDPSLEDIHESLTWKWWPAEIVPKRTWNEKSKRTSFDVGLGRHRSIKPGSLIDQSALLRMRKLPYHPANLPTKFLEKVRQLEQVPETLPFVES
jgi:uncharacterized protein (DUF2235 family)